MKKGLIYLGADHAGFSLKERVKEYLIKEGYAIVDLGANELKKDDDYPEYAFSVGEHVSSSKNSRGILLCGSGNGMVIAANKVKGVRAIEGYDEYSTKMSRIDNDANVLSIGARSSSFEKAKKIIDIWLKTEFSGAKRHVRRLKRIKNYEK